MVRIDSEKQIIGASSEKIYEFLNDFNNFGQLMPEQVVGWESTEESCRFRIEGIAELSMEIGEREPGKLIVYKSGEPSPFEFEIRTEIIRLEASQSRTQIIFNANINGMMQIMLQKPIGNLVNILNGKLKEELEKR